MFFALANAILIIPLGVVPSWLALASTGCDVLGLGVAVALVGRVRRGSGAARRHAALVHRRWRWSVLLGGQMLIGIALTRQQTTAQIALTVLLFTSLAIATSVQVLADPLAGLLDRLVFSRSPLLRADRETLRRTQSALPLRSADPLDDFDDDTFARLTRRALGHYGDLSKLVASPLTALPAIDERLAARGAPDQPLERAIELKALLADASRGSNRATAVTSAPPSSGATTTRCISLTSSVCARTPRTPPPPDWTRRPGKPGSGSSPRSRSVRCTTGRTPRPGSSPPICAAGSPSPSD